MPDATPNPVPEWIVANPNSAGERFDKARLGSTAALNAAQLAIVPILVLCVWEAAVDAGWISQMVLSSPSSIAAALFQQARSGGLWMDVGITLRRVAIGYGLAILIAVPTGLILGTSKTVRRLFITLLELLRPVPPIALIPVAILWLGIGEASKIFIIAYASIWPILLNVILGVESVPPIVQNTAKSLGLTGIRYFRKVVLPNSVPQVMVGLRVAGAISFVVVVAAEMVASTAGLGFGILDAERTFRTPDMFAGIVMLAVLGALVNLGLLHLERAATKWR
jgi:ABC-type nitrate/sulfonate/bicarbonate transport system permease component